MIGVGRIDEDTVQVAVAHQPQEAGLHHVVGMNALDEADQKKKDALQKEQIGLVSQGFGAAADLAKNFAGEQSKTYQAMFAASKAFATAQLAIDQAKAIGKAWGENNYWVAAGLTVGMLLALTRSRPQGELEDIMFRRGR